MVFYRAYKEYNLFRTTSIIWMVLDYLLTILPFESTLIVIHISSVEEGKNKVNELLMYSIISLALIVFSFAINPKRHMRCYRKAYVRLADSINRYINAFSYSIAVKDTEPSQGEIISGNIQLADLLKNHDVTKGNDDNIKFDSKDLVEAMKDAENLINPSYDVD